MRFSHVNHRYAPFVGGSERYMQEVSEWLASAGHQVNMFTSDAFDLEYFWDASRARIVAPEREMLNGVHVTRVPVQHLPVNPILFQGSRRAMGELSRFRLPARPFEMIASTLPHMPRLQVELDATGPVDLVHAANLGIEGLALLASRTARAYNSPFVITPFIHLGRSGDVNARRYVSMPHQKELLRQASSVIVMTQIEANFVESLGIERHCIFVSGVGIRPEEVTGGNPDRFRSTRRVSGNLVGVAGAVAFDKGSRELVLAVGELRRRGHDVGLILAGPRLLQFDRWFESLDSGARDGIHIVGFLSAEEKRDMLAAIDILAMPSRTESFGIAYLEGWANQKPVIAANAGAVPELVRNGENGVLVEFGDVDAIAQAILDLLADPCTARRFGKAGYELTLSRFTWPAVLERVMDAYSHALGFQIGGSDTYE